MVLTCYCRSYKGKHAHAQTRLVWVQNDTTKTQKLLHVENNKKLTFSEMAIEEVAVTVHLYRKYIKC